MATDSPLTIKALRAMPFPSPDRIANAQQDIATANIGKVAIDCVEQLNHVILAFLDDAAVARPEMRGYRDTFDRIAGREVHMLRGLPREMQVAFGLHLQVSGLLDEFAAFGSLLSQPTHMQDGKGDDDKDEKEKKKKAADNLQKELKKIWPKWLPEPDWDKVRESIGELL